MIALLVIITVLLSVTLIILAVGTLFYMKRFDKVAEEMEKTLTVVRNEVLPLAADMRRVLANVDSVVVGAQKQLDRTKRVTEFAEELLDGRSITRAAGIAVSSSKNTLLAAIDRIKQGFRALRNPTDRSKEDQQNEQST